MAVHAMWGVILVDLIHVARHDIEGKSKDLFGYRNGLSAAARGIQRFVFDNLLVKVNQAIHIVEVSAGGTHGTALDRLSADDACLAP